MVYVIERDSDGVDVSTSNQSSNYGMVVDWTMENARPEEVREYFDEVIDRALELMDLPEACGLNGVQGTLLYVVKQSAKIILESCELSDRAIANYQALAGRS